MSQIPTLYVRFVYAKKTGVSLYPIQGLIYCPIKNDSGKRTSIDYYTNVSFNKKGALNFSGGFYEQVEVLLYVGTDQPLS